MTNPTLKRYVPILALAGVALLGAACHSSSNENDIKPVHASVEFELQTPPPGPVVYLRVASNYDPSLDLVPLEVVLDPGGGSVTFDAFNVEILPTDTVNTGLVRDGVVSIVFDAAAGTTPFGACNTCIATAGCGFTPPAAPPACTACSASICSGLTPPSSTATTPLCFAGKTSTHSTQVSVASVPASGCAAATVSQPTVIATITAVAQTTGSVLLRFVDDQVTQNSGTDCAILLNGVDQHIQFNERIKTTFTANR
ncbi:MAG TPA: hypothetical protein VGS03_16390 [Candidatus Polarisedimenticolia bacterium]|jgi:hypothetical protein|nr:hypothetical protein [Candidatus Polarisedimenticolia bacterium]